MEKTNTDIIKKLDEISHHHKKGNINALKGFEKIESSISEEARKITEENGKLNKRTSKELQKVGNEINRRGNAIKESIDKTNYEFGYQLDKVNNNLFHIDCELTRINQTLENIHDSLTKLVKLISMPNEVEALELANQTRINLALDRRQEALKIAKKARSICGTSIPVNAYYILALTAQKENNLDIVKNSVSDYAKLITFKLKDNIKSESLNKITSKGKELLSIIIKVTYPLIFELSNKFGAAILPQIKEIYNAVNNHSLMYLTFYNQSVYNSEVFNSITTIKSIIKELHLVLFYEFTNSVISDNNKNVIILLNYINLVKKSKSVISPELIKKTSELITKNKFFRKMFDLYFSNCNNKLPESAINSWIEYEFLPNPNNFSLPIKFLTMKFIDKNKNYDHFSTEQFNDFLTSYNNLFKKKENEFRRKLNETKTKLKKKAKKIKNEIENKINAESKEIHDKISYSLNMIGVLKQKKQENENKKGRFPWTSTIPIIITILVPTILILRIQATNWQGGFDTKHWWDLIVGIILVAPIFIIIMVIAFYVSYLTIALFKLNYDEKDNAKYSKNIKKLEDDINKIEQFKVNFDKNDNLKYSKNIKNLKDNTERKENEIDSVFGDIKSIKKYFSNRILDFKEYYKKEHKKLEDLRNRYVKYFYGDFKKYCNESDFSIDVPSINQYIKKYNFSKPLDHMNQQIDLLIKDSKYCKQEEGKEQKTCSTN